MQSLLPSTAGDESTTIAIMRQGTKTFIFWLFVLLFFAVTPVVMLYTVGYRFNSRAFSLERTGLLVVASEPKGATITLDGQLRSEKTPARLQNLLPGIHTLTVTLPQSQIWSQPVVINGGKTTFADDIIIFNTPSKPQTLLATPLTHITLANDGYSAAAVQKDADGSRVVRYDSETGTVSTLATFAPDVTINQILPTPHSNLWLLEVTGDAVPHWQLARDAQIIPLPQLPLDAKEITWQAGNLAFWFLQGDSAWYMPLENGTPQLVANHVLSLTRLADTAYALVRTAEQPELYLLDQAGVQLMGKMPIENRDWKFMPQQKTALALVDMVAQTGLMFDPTTWQLLVALPHVDYLAWQQPLAVLPSTEQPDLLYGDAYEISVLDYQSHQRSYQQKTLARYVTPMSNVLWHPSARAVLYTQGNDLFAVAVANATSTQTFRLASLAQPPALMIVANKGAAIDLLYNDQAPSILRYPIVDR